MSLLSTGIKQTSDQLEDSGVYKIGQLQDEVIVVGPGNQILYFEIKNSQQNTYLQILWNNSKGALVWDPGKYIAFNSLDSGGTLIIAQCQ